MQLCCWEEHNCLLFGMLPILKAKELNPKQAVHKCIYEDMASFLVYEKIPTAVFAGAVKHCPSIPYDQPHSAPILLAHFVSIVQAVSRVC